MFFIDDDERNGKNQDSGERESDAAFEPRADSPQLKLLADTVPGGLALYVFSDGNFRLTYFNNAFCQILDVSREECERLANSSDSAFSMFCDEDRPNLINQFEELLRSNALINCTCRVLTRKDRRRWAAVRGAVSERSGSDALISVALIDISRQKETEERLRANEEILRPAVEHSGRAIYRYDPLSRQALSVSPQACQAMGLPRFIAHMPKSLIENGLILPEDAERLRLFFSTASIRKMRDSILFRVIDEKGKIRWIDAKYTIITDSLLPAAARPSTRFTGPTDPRLRESVSQNNGRTRVFFTSPPVLYAKRSNYSAFSVFILKSANAQCKIKHQRGQAFPQHVPFRPDGVRNKQRASTFLLQFAAFSCTMLKDILSSSTEIQIIFGAARSLRRRQDVWRKAAAAYDKTVSVKATLPMDTVFIYKRHKIDRHQTLVRGRTQIQCRAGCL